MSNPHRFFSPDHNATELSVRYKTPDIPGLEHGHIHRELEIVMILSDHVHCTIGQRDYILDANTLVLFNNFERHFLNVAGEGFCRHVCIFSPSFLGGDSQEDLLACFFVKPTEEINILKLEPEDAALFHSLFRQMEQIMEMPKDTYARRQELRLLLQVLLLEINRRRREELGMEISSGKYTVISNILSVIQDEVDSPDLTLEALCRRFAVSRTALAKDFKDVTGTTVHQYLMDCRIWRAADLLKQGYSVEESGAAVGFQALSHFSRCFKMRVGKSPKQFAMEYRSRDVLPRPASNNAQT